MEDEQQLTEKAYRWLKSNKSKIINRFANSAEFHAETHPTSIFMAGSPGAGKTEFSRQLITKFTQKPVLIDADEIRKECPGYNGENAHIYQRAATKGVHELYTHALRKKFNLILDGTFGYSKVRENIERSIKKGRKVEVFFIYNDLLQAWEFVKVREEDERRRVTKDVFIDTYFKSVENIRSEKAHFGSSIQLNVIVKNLDTEEDQIKLDVKHIDDFDLCPYTKDELHKLLV
jgi:UDP-N-acetylglucosamine kinase